MRTVVIGGHTRNIGKTALAVDIIRALPEARWTAVKVTLYGHRFCSDHAGGCDCAPRGGGIAVEEESDRGGGTDTSRFLAAGAERSYWVRAHREQLAEALPAIRTIIRSSQNVILESNSLVGFLRPDLYLVVLDPRQADFKPSARRFLDLANAVVLRAPLSSPAWEGVPIERLERLAVFSQPEGEGLPAGLVDLVRSSVQGAGDVPGRHGRHLSC